MCRNSSSAREGTRRGDARDRTSIDVFSRPAARLRAVPGGEFLSSRSGDVARARSDASGAPRCTASPTVPPALTQAATLPVHPWRASPLQQGVKRGMDIVISAVLLVVLSPLLLAIALMFLKFRSMRQGADRVLEQHLRASPAAQTEWSVFQHLTADPRVTRPGRILRQLSLGELPQLWNVLKGEMSLVGPRPAWSGRSVCMPPAGRTTVRCAPG